MKKRIAIPLEGGILCSHFGHCEQFAIVDAEGNAITKETLITPPPHEPGLLPGWLAERGVNLVIAGGMGGRAQQLFTEAGVKVIVGATSAEPESVVRDYLAGNLVTGANVCDH